MSASRICLLKPKLIIMITMITLFNGTVKNGLLASAQMLIKPLWNISANISNPCIVKIDNDDEVQLTGSPDHSCSLQMNASNETSIHLQMQGFMNESLTESFLFLEHFEELENDSCFHKYVVFNDLSHACIYVIPSKYMEMMLFGGATIIITCTTAESAVPQCSVDAQDITDDVGNEISRCMDVRRYSKKLKCADEYHDVGYCRLNFEATCDVILGPREAIYECGVHNLSQTHRVVIPYPDGVLNDFRDILLFLDLDGNQIVQLNADCFVGLSKLKELYLHENKLSVLPKGIFQQLLDLEVLMLTGNRIHSLNSGCWLGLSNLKVLYLDYNALRALPKHIFRDLVNLERLALNSNRITTLSPECFQGLTELWGLNMSDNMLHHLPDMVFQDLQEMEWLNISSNRLREIPEGLFNNSIHLDRLLLTRNALTMMTGCSDLVTVDELYLDYNNLSVLPKDIFNNLHDLSILILHANNINVLNAEVFAGLSYLRVLILSNNRLSYLPERIFHDLYSLEWLSLSSNRLKDLPGKVFKNLITLRVLNLAVNSLTMIGPASFSDLPMNALIQVSQNEICECFVPNHICYAVDRTSPYLTCDRLLSDKILAVFMWLVGFSAFCGNIFVLIWRNRLTNKNKVNSILLSNLATSDFLMGIYMLIIGSADVYFGDQFPMRAENWRTGITCRIAGALSIISSEASVFFVVLISIDRYICICFPYSVRKLTKASVTRLALFVWMFSVILGIVPAVLSGRYFEFYDNSHVCIGLPLAIPTINNYTILYVDGVSPVIRSYSVQVTGNYYSIALFLGLNAVCYLVVLGCYVRIVRAVRSSAAHVGRSHDMVKQLKLTKKVTAIVATDFFCWAPVITLGILVQTRVIALSASVFAWCVTFVLPINSAINPFVYTIADVIYKHRKGQKTQLSSDNKDREAVQSSHL